MDRSLRPDRLELDSSDTECHKKWAHWKRIFEVYIASIETTEKPVKKLDYIIGLVSHTIYDLIEDSKDYASVIKTLDEHFGKKVNILHARHVLLTRKQNEGETLSQFLTALKSLSKDCAFEAVNADKHREGYIRDAFVSGLNSVGTKQKILESKETSLQDIFTLAEIYENAKANVQSFASPLSLTCQMAPQMPAQGTDNQPTSAAVKKSFKSNYHHNRNKS